MDVKLKLLLNDMTSEVIRRLMSGGEIVKVPRNIGLNYVLYYMDFFKCLQVVGLMRVKLHSLDYFTSQSVNFAVKQINLYQILDSGKIDDENQCFANKAKQNYFKKFNLRDEQGEALKTSDIVCREYDLTRFLEKSLFKFELLENLFEFSERNEKLCQSSLTNVIKFTVSSKSSIRYFNNFKFRKANCLVREIFEGIKFISFRGENRLYDILEKQSGNKNKIYRFFILNFKRKSIAKIAVRCKVQTSIKRVRNI